ncbi:MAG: Gfo/Idh/MocA family protein [Akkermansiaceae bacterium]
MKKIGIILNGVTGRMGTNQHLVRSILAIREQGGVTLSDGTLLMPDPILTGRNEDKLRALAQEHGVEKFTTDLDSVLADPYYELFFDASGTPYRIPFLERAIAAGKHIYCEKPTATEASEAFRIAEVAEAAGVKNGTVQDKLWLPGIMAFKKLKKEGFFGEILSVRGEFGYWVFSGHDENQPAQRPSWNYREEDGGGIIIDMHCHWRYVIDNLFGTITSVFTHASTHLPERVGEDGQPYKCTADDAAYALFKTETGVICQFNSSWDVRVRRDDLLTMQVDGTKGSAIVGLRKCWAQSLENTPRPVWNPDVDSPIDYYANWDVIDPGECDNAFKIQWELFLQHLAEDTEFPWTLREGAKGVDLAEKSWQSHHEGKWVEL